MNDALPPLRLIARLDVKGANVVKGIHLEGLRVVGRPGDLARRYYSEDIDEIIYMDIVASLYGRNSILSVVEEAARDIFVPITVGGGIRSVADIVAALRSGADKVAINTAAIARPQFLREAAEAVGSQAIVVSIEAKRREDGTWEAQTDNGRERTGRNVLDWATEAENLGAGEILLTSIDREGTRKGFDVELLRLVRNLVRIPVIASGGAGTVDHIAEVLDGRTADGAAIASLFHYGNLTPRSAKQTLHASNRRVRLAADA